ncbi:hypothetical protein [Micromonospora sp. NBRC 101691]|uniref:hypothetical protein n=1 Tax=Micromonospora sp. NBRC 101691 TaxID=3032198 RepID=UPI00249FD853|nr:hypothetical protein [Micromonospora sp. NBRC 101691]GLY22811.1 hypothetical protein Misp04_25430 [Micromonospora sp. NBRC 101691]
MRRFLTLLAGAVVAATVAVAAPAAAAPDCEVPVPPPICNPIEDPPPPEGSDKSPTGRVESYGFAHGTFNVRGWARDVNGGPVTIWVNVDGPFVGGYTAGLWHAGQGGNVGFDITVPAPSTVGTHQVLITLVNVPDGTQPAAPYSSLLNYLTYTVEATPPANLSLTPVVTNGQDAIVVGFTDLSTAEEGYQITYDWMARRMNDDGHWVLTPESRTVHVGPNPGTGWYSHTITGLVSNTFYRFYIRTKENGRMSTPTTGGVSTLD